MSIAAYKPPSVTIPINDKLDFKVRGLNLDDIAGLVTLNLEPIVEAVAHYQAARSEVYTSQGITGLILTVSGKFPELTSEIISIASDNDGSPAQCRSLPAGVQLAALNAIFKMTLEDLGGLKNLWGVMEGALREAARLDGQTLPAKLSRAMSTAYEQRLDS